MILGEVGIVGDDLLVRHPGGEPSEHVGNGDAHPAYVGRPPRFPGSMVIMSW